MALEPLHADGGIPGSALLLALSRDPMASVSPSASCGSSSSGCLLDLVEVISVDSSDEENRPTVVPLQLVHVKQEKASESGGGGIGVVKYELRAVEPTENHIVDLCSDDDDDDDNDTTVGDRDVGDEPAEVANEFVYEHARHRVGGSDKQLSVGTSTTICFKRRKILHDGTPGSKDTTASSSSSESDSEFAFSDNGDDDSSATEDGYDEDDNDESEGEKLLSSGGRCSAPRKQRPLFHHPSSSSSPCSLTREQVDEIILRDVQRLEAKKPWRFAYRCLEVPFKINRTVDTFDLLFERWDAFWSSYGRAVWERYFWAPLKPGTLEYHRRKHRQTRAMRTFRELVRDLHRKLGPGFLRNLTRTAHDGWWYRSGPLVLCELFYLDPRKYKMYMTLHRERFPRGSRFERSLDPVWCLPDAELTGADRGSGCGGIGAACLAWQDVTKSDDDDDDEFDDECG